MATEGSSHTTVLVILVVAIVAFVLLSKASATVSHVNASVRQTYTTGTAVAAVATNLAPVLGKFLSTELNNYQSGGSSASYPTPYDTSSYQSVNPGDVVGGQSGDGLAIPAYAADDTTNFSG